MCPKICSIPGGISQNIAIKSYFIYSFQTPAGSPRGSASKFINEKNLLIKAVRYDLLIAKNSPYRWVELLNGFREARMYSQAEYKLEVFGA